MTNPLKPDTWNLPMLLVLAGVLLSPLCLGMLLGAWWIVHNVDHTTLYIVLAVWVAILPIFLRYALRLLDHYCGKLKQEILAKKARIAEQA